MREFCEWKLLANIWKAKTFLFLRALFSWHSRVDRCCWFCKYWLTKKNCDLRIFFYKHIDTHSPDGCWLSKFPDLEGLMRSVDLLLGIYASLPFSDCFKSILSDSFMVNWEYNFLCRKFRERFLQSLLRVSKNIFIQRVEGEEEVKFKFALKFVKKICCW